MAEGAVLEFLRRNTEWCLETLRARLAQQGGDETSLRLFLERREAAARALEELSRRDGIPFFQLLRRFGLTPLEAQVIGLCLGQMVEPEVGALLAQLHGAPGRVHVTAGGVALLLFANEPEARTQALTLLSARSKLRAHRIVEEPLFHWDGILDTPLYLTRSCLAWLTGQTIAAPCFRFTPAPPRDPNQPAAFKRAVVAENEAARAYRLVSSMAFALNAGAPLADQEQRFILLLLWGVPGAGKATFARELAFDLFDGVVEVDGEALVGRGGDPRDMLREAFDCAVLRGALLLIENGGALLKQGTVARYLVDTLRDCPLCVVVTAAERDLGPAIEGALTLSLHMHRPRPVEMVALWQAHLPPGVPLDADVDLAALGERYAISPAGVARAARMAVAECVAASGEKVNMERLERAARAQLDGDMGDLVSTIYPSHAFEDLVLPEEDLYEIYEIVMAYRNWHHVMGRWGMGARLSTGKCITALFYGAPGTGKSFAAEVIASVIGEPLHIVNLPNILSKWMGETERNIHLLFRQGRLNNSIILFDEADSLFSSRVEVRSAQDHSMNMITGQLLQELDRHTGLVIMTTNLTENIDPAFRRRMLYSLEFMKPDYQARRDIWRRMLPPSVPRAADVDLDALARDFELTGGEIKNAALRAVLTAYAEAGPVQMQQLVVACEREYKQTGRLIAEKKAGARSAAGGKHHA